MQSAETFHSSLQKKQVPFFRTSAWVVIVFVSLMAIANVFFGTPTVALYNALMVVIFGSCYFLLKSNLRLTIVLCAFIYQLFIFGHAYWFLPGKHLEIGLGLFTCMLPVFFKGRALWCFFISNTILFHIAFFNAGYTQIFVFQYCFYIGLYLIIQTIIKENQQYEQELIIQRDKIKSDALALKELDELKTRFFANISHELRTPLTLILSPLESVLESKDLSSHHRTYLQLIQENGRKLHKHINELLSLSRMDAGGLSMQESPVLAKSFFEKLMASFEGLANSKNIRLTFIYDLTENLKLSLDKGKVETIISNFLSNALKFTPDGGSIIFHVGQAAQQLQIEVVDTGSGLSPMQQEKVFDRFYQTTKSTYIEGSGIGLALAKELAQVHGGTVGVKSEIGKGSTFYVHLPFKEVFTNIEPQKMIDLPNVPEAKTIISALATTPSKTILIVEDNADLRKYLQLILMEKYKIILAKNGQEAMSFLTQTSTSSSDTLPALIISDIMMPVMGGMELLKAVKEQDKLRHIPIIMLTAHQNTAIKMDALRIGVDDYLTKPFKKVELLARVNNLIHNSTIRTNLSTGIKSTSPIIPKISQLDLKWLKEVEEKILTNLSNSQFRLSDLAAELNITPRRFQQKTKSITGLTPKQYQRNIQLSEARKILKSKTVKTVAEVSYQLNFEDPNYFSKLYKKQYGISPREEFLL